MESLAEAISKEQKRVCKVLSRYKEIDPAEQSDAIIIEAALQQTDKNIVNGYATRPLIGTTKRLILLFAPTTK